MAVMKKRTLWIAAGAVVVIGVGLGLGLTLGRSGDKNESASTTQSTYEVQRGNILQTLVVYGEVVPKQEYTFTFSADRVDSISVSVGERVEEGETLVQLDSTSQQLSLLQAERSLAEAQAGGAQADVQEKQLAYQMALRNYNEATLTAPFAGVVSEINQPTGSSGSWSLVLLDTSELYVEATVDQLDAPDVAVGQSATALVEALPDRTYRVQVVEVGGMAKSQGNSTVVVVKGKLPEADPDVLVGYTAQMEITTASASDVLIVPVTAISESPRGWMVMKVVDGETSPQIVTIGAQSDTYVEIQSGLEEGDVILDSGSNSQSATSSSQQDRSSRVFQQGGFTGGSFTPPGMP
jgi:multidrug efflux pump subunit AcrA (membrane-fusion protein)